MKYAMMKKATKLMPLLRHKPSHNPRLAYTLVDEDMAVVDALMRISSQTESEFGSPDRDEMQRPPCSSANKARCCRGSNRGRPGGRSTDRAMARQRFSPDECCDAEDARYP